MAPCRDCKKFKAEISRLEEINSNLRDQLKSLQSLSEPDPEGVPTPNVLDWELFDDSLALNFHSEKDSFDKSLQKQLKNSDWIHDLNFNLFMEQSKIDVDGIFNEPEDPDLKVIYGDFFVEQVQEEFAPEPFVHEGVVFEPEKLPQHQRIVHGYYKPPTSRQSSGSHTNQLEFLATLLPKVIDHKSAKKFINPIVAMSTKLYGYHTYTKDPMDLKTIQERITNRFYNNSSQCISDFKLIIQNCLFCQEDHDHFEDATALEAFWEEQIKSMPKPEVTLKNPSNTSAEVPTVNPVVNPQLGPVVSRKRQASSSAAPNPSTKPRVEEAAVDPSPSGSKPSFQCPHCDKEPYTNRQNMNRHVLTKHKSVKYSCPICGKPLGRSDNLKIHMRDRHSD